MYENKKIFAIIPARSGSKGVSHKNIRHLNGKPMLAYSILHAKESKYIDRIIVSTDSKEYANIAKEYGAEVPFLRPADISGDDSLDIECFYHAYKWLDENSELPFAFVHLRPTHPIRESIDIDNMIEKLVKCGGTSVRSVCESEETPYKMWRMDELGKLENIVACHIVEAYNAPRQKLPKTYTQNACIDVILTRTIAEGSMTGKDVIGHILQYNFDVDTENDFLKAERMLLVEEVIKSNKKLKIVCDIDGVIASKTEKDNYKKASPIFENIKFINDFYEKGHDIVLFTARGYVTGIDWEEITKKQLKKWGVKYNAIIFNKPNADVYIDDKFFDIETLRRVL